MPCCDIVEPGVDVASDDEFHREPFEEMSERPSRVDPDMVTEDVPKQVGSVVDQRKEAEVVALSDEKTVCLKGIEPVWGKDDNMPPRADASNSLFDGFTVILYMLDNFVQENDVEGIWSKWQAFGSALYDARELGSGGGNLVWIDVRSPYVLGELAQSADVGAHAAADVQNPLVLQGDVRAHQV